MKITFKEMQAEMAALQKKMAEFQKQQAPEQVGRVALNADEAEWILLSDGRIFIFDGTSTVHSNVLAQGNCFTTKLAAELARDRRELVQQMAMAASESDGSARCHPFWDGGKWDVMFVSDYRYSQLPHFSSRGSLIDFMQTLTPDQQKLLICGVV